MVTDAKESTTTTVRPTAQRGVAISGGQDGSDRKQHQPQPPKL